MDSSPSPASPTTSMSASSSSIRRKPRRTRLWSSTSKTVMFFGIRFCLLPWYRQVDQRSAFRWTRNDDLPTHQFSTLAHCDQPNATLIEPLREARSVVLHLQLQRLRQETQKHANLLRPRMPSCVVQGLLHNAVDMNARTAVHREGLSLLLIGYGNPG